MATLEARLKGFESLIESTDIFNTYYVEAVFNGVHGFRFKNEDVWYPLDQFKIEAAKRWEKSGKRDIGLNKVLPGLTPEQLYKIRSGKKIYETD